MKSLYTCRSFSRIEVTCALSYLYPRIQRLECFEALGPSKLSLEGSLLGLWSPRIQFPGWSLGHDLVYMCRVQSMTLHLNVLNCRLDSTHVNMVMSHWPTASNGMCILGPRFPSSRLSLWFEELLHIGVQNPGGEFMGWRSPCLVIIVCILKLLPLIEMCRGFDGSIIYLCYHWRGSVKSS